MDTFTDLKQCVKFYDRTCRNLHLKGKDQQTRCCFYSPFSGSVRGRIIGVIVSHHVEYIFQETGTRNYGQITALTEGDLHRFIFEKHLHRKNGMGKLVRSDDFISNLRSKITGGAL